MCIEEQACLDSVVIDHLFFSLYVLALCTLHCDNSLTNKYLPLGPHRILLGPYSRRATPLWLTTMREAGQEVKKQRGSKINLLPLQAIISIQAGHNVTTEVHCNVTTEILSAKKSIFDQILYSFGHNSPCAF